MDCKIITPQRIFVYNKLKSVLLPAESGQVQILPFHAEIFILLKAGEIVLGYSENKKKRVAIKSGLAYFRDNFLTIIL